MFQLAWAKTWVNSFPQTLQIFCINQKMSLGTSVDFDRLMLCKLDSAAICHQNLLSPVPVRNIEKACLDLPREKHLVKITSKKNYFISAFVG